MRLNPEYRAVRRRSHARLAAESLASLFVLTMISGCLAPFSDLQSAKLAGPGRLEITPGFSTISVAAEGESESVQNNFGIQLATGLHEIMDLRLRYERIELDDADEGVNVLGVGPKFGILPDYVALAVPFGFAFGNDVETSETVQVHPTVLASYPAHELIELNGSAKVLFPLVNREEIDDLLAFNFGLALGPDLNEWAVRPEVGFLFNPGEDGHGRHFSIGFTYYVDFDD